MEKSLINCCFALILLGTPFAISAAGLDDFELADDEVKSAFAEEGIAPDLIYLHKDWQSRDSAPLIQVQLFDEPASVGSYAGLSELFSGKSEPHQLILLDTIVDQFIENSRAVDFPFIEEINGFFFTLVYLVPEDNAVWWQYQMWSWPEKVDPGKKCVIASDVEERVRDFYEDTISESMVQLASLCVEVFHSEERAETPS